MSNRDHFIATLRGETLGEINSKTSAEELFQNQTLRPILKFQNDLYIELLKNYIIKSKANFDTFTIEKKCQFIEISIQKDTKFKGLLIGVVIGLFTIDEYLMYIKNTSSLNRRMISMLIERLKNQLQLI